MKIYINSTPESFEFNFVDKHKYNKLIFNVDRLFEVLEKNKQDLVNCELKILDRSSGSFVHLKGTALRSWYILKDIV